MVEQADACLELGSNRDHSEARLWNVAGGGVAGGDGGSARLAHSTGSTYSKVECGGDGGSSL